MKAATNLFTSSVEDLEKAFSNSNLRPRQLAPNTNVLCKANDCRSKVSRWPHTVYVCSPCILEMGRAGLLSGTIDFSLIEVGQKRGVQCEGSNKPVNLICEGFRKGPFKCKSMAQITGANAGFKQLTAEVRFLGGLL